MDDHTASSIGQRHGFTLIELVVTITLLGIVLASAALLGRHAVDPIRNMSESTRRAIESQDYAYLSRRLDEIAVMVSWSDSTLSYLDDCGITKKIDLAALWRTSDSDRTTMRLEVGPVRDDAQSVHHSDLLNQSSNLLDAVQVRLYMVTGRTNPDTLCLVRTVPFLSNPR